MTLLTSSAKSKGRRLQAAVRDYLLAIGKRYGLEPADIRSTSMGCPGVDLQLSPAAQKLFDFLIECKNQESLAVSTEFQAHFEKYQDKDGIKLLVHKRNRTEILVTLRWTDFMAIIAELLELKYAPQSQPA